MVRSFEAEVERAFGFLVSEFGLSGPAEGAGDGPSRVRYSGESLNYQIVFDPATRAVTTIVAKDIGAVRFTAELPALVLGAALGTPANVRSDASTLSELRATVLAQAGYVRRLQPYLTPLNVVPLMRAAHATEDAS
ncbi:hypothetical protein ACQP2F_29980 [Actinoplanes sp. CA-030573]|uniref:hypothetical protein n=1 Tax=Actinoplanes sp. CA-030573 TaxID=3239898 RepID=UPI003D8BFD76